MATFSRAVSQGKRLGDWKTTARSGSAPSTFQPSRRIAPLEIGLSPAAIVSTVDLPQPEWPMSEMNSPLFTLRSKSSTTVSGPFGVG